MTRKERVRRRALVLASEWIAKTCPPCNGCPCSKKNDTLRTCFGPCDKEIAKEFLNLAYGEELERKAGVLKDERL